MANASGFARDILTTATAVLDGANPETKITSPGFLRLLKQKASGAEISSLKQNAAGHFRDIKFRYRQRSVPGESQSTSSCDADNFPLYKEATITQSLFRQVSLNFDFETIAKFENEASAYRALNPGNNAPASLGGMMNVVWDAIANKMNALLGDMDIDLITKMNTNWGYNAKSGLNTATTLNFPLNGTNNDLTAGVTGLLEQVMMNEMDINNTAIIGSGLITNYWLQNVVKNAKSADQAGLSTPALGMPAFFPDYYTSSVWGANKFGVVDPRALTFLDLNIYQDYRARHLGTSTYFKMPLIVTDSFGQQFQMDFDIQIKETDCPVSIDNSYGDPLTVGPGITVFIRKSFDLYVEPGDVYGANDRLKGNNGTLLYLATNA